MEGKTWTARNEDEKAEAIKKDSFVIVKAIEGVKLIVSKEV